MKNKWSVIILAAALLISGCTAAGKNTTDLVVSGMIEAKSVRIASMQSGRVETVFAQEGDTVTKGDELIRLEDSIIRLQMQLAQAGLQAAQSAVKTANVSLEAARAQYEYTLTLALAASRITRTLTWNEIQPGDFDQPAWYFTNMEREISTQSVIESISGELKDSRTNLESIEKSVGSASFIAIEQELSDARVKYQLALMVLEKANQAQDGISLVDAARNSLDDAETELEKAQADYDNAISTEAAQDIMEARARVRVFQEQYDLAVDALHGFQTGANSPEVILAKKSAELAQAGVEQAQAAVVQAQAQLDLVSAQIKELTVYSSLDGVVLTRSIEPGEMIQAGQPVMNIARLDQLHVTVYIPENRYGEIMLGQETTFLVDSFPGETFTARVTRIADHAEFTPRNVQTTEGRQTTVYAVELSIDNPDNRLKPGMPVDVKFTN